jgi:hypothetical protein
LKDESECSINNEANEYLVKQLKKKKSELTLYYRGSRDGWMAKDFHSLCDDKGPTLTLQIEDGECIGCYTNQSWSSPDKWEFKTDSGAFLFNLTRRTSFPCLKHEEAIGCKKNCGPNFGVLELSVVGEPFNKEDACNSWANESDYKIPRNSEGINMLTNKKGLRFTIS